MFSGKTLLITGDTGNAVYSTNAMRISTVMIEKLAMAKSRVASTSKPLSKAKRYLR